jgi:4-amino-4-deoxy-L-arabinose transferase-like glycosyltransferase
MNPLQNTQKANSYYNLLFLGVLAISFALVTSSLSQINFAKTADEGLYLNYATHINENGISGFRDFFKNYFDKPEYRIFQNPLRVGFIILSAISLKIFGHSFFSLTFLSLFFFYAFLLVSFCFVKKYFGKETAILFIILLAFSPLNMAMARRALTDATSNFFMTSSVLLFFWNIKEPKIYKTALFIMLYAFTILVRENSVLLSIFFVIYLLRDAFVSKKHLKLTDCLVVTVFPFAITGATYIILAGGISPFLKVVISIATSREINNYAIFACSGPWFRYLIDFMLLSPWVCLLAIGFFFYYIFKNQRQGAIEYLLIFSVVLLFIYGNLIWKCVRYLMVLDMPMRLFAVLMLCDLAKLIFKDRAFKVSILLVILISSFDYYNFNYMFVVGGIYDPISFSLLQAAHIIPWK